MLWYEKIVQKQWQKLVNLKQKDSKPEGKVLLTAIIQAIVTYTVLAILIQLTQAGTFITGAGIGALIWLGFIATTMLNPVLWLKQPLQLYWINATIYLITLIINGGILAIWA
jgi:hypothetical protein